MTNALLIVIVCLLVLLVFVCFAIGDMSNATYKHLLDKKERDYYAALDDWNGRG